MDQESPIAQKERQRVKPKVTLTDSGPKVRETTARPPRFQIPFTRKNYIAFAVGLGFLVLGYICLAQPPADGFLSLTLAPILLVIGYCVVFPYAILTREKPRHAEKPTV